MTHGTGCPAGQFIETHRVGKSKKIRAEQGSAGFLSRHGVTLAGVLIVLAGGAAYAGSLDGAFVFDDQKAIVHNLTIRTLWPLWMPLSPPGEGVAVQNRPIVNLSLAANYAVGDLNVRGYHVFNIIVHIAAALALFGVVRRTLRSSGMPRHLSEASLPLALAIALLWVAHPLQTEAVTFVVQRAEEMTGLLLLTTLYCFIRGAGSRRPALWYIAAVAACALGMGCKEVMAVTPLIVLAYDRVYVAASWRELFRRRWPFYAGLAATWVILAALVIPTGQRGTAAGFGHGMTSWEYARTQFGVIVHYLRLCYWPHPLVIDYGAAVANGAAEIVPYAIVVAALATATLIGIFYRPKLAFLGAWFFVILAPSSSVIPLAAQTAAEKRMYLPLAAVITLTVLAGYEAWRWLSAKFSANPRGGFAVRVLSGLLLAGILAVMFAATWSRNADYASAMTLWKQTVRDCPNNPRAHWNLGEQWNLAKNYPEAIREFDAGLAIGPEDSDAYRGRGIALGMMGRYDDAVRDLDSAIVLMPNFAEAYHDRGLLFAMSGRHERAVADFTCEVSLSPDAATAYYRRGLSLQALGRYEPALADFDKAKELRLDYPEIHLACGECLVRTGRAEAAVAEYSRAIEVMPDDGAAYAGRAIADFYVRQYGRAWADVEAARRLGVEPSPEFLQALKDATEKGKQ
jgi:tetratricopeptide (TPR) repeat protein